MGLCADLNDPHPVGPVFMPPTGLSFMLVDTAPSGKTNVPKHISPSDNLWWENIKVSPSAFQLITGSIIPLLDLLIITSKL